MVNPDFVKIAAGYKIAAESISERKDLKESIMKMLDATGPYLLEIKIDKEANVLPMIEPGASVSEVTLTYKK
jgi:acetolactate synthase-1/2/3 large subunit